MKQTSVQLDPHNTEFISALDHVRNTSDNLFLTGKAGSGKTHFLHALMASDAENMVVVAPTGIAAINAGGVTINSFFQIAPSPFLHNDERLCTPEDLRRRGIIRQSDEPHGIFENVRFGDDRLKVIKNLQRLVIDEVSMVRADMIDAIDKILRVFRGRPEPFGGVQMIFIGDLFQLPPVLDTEDEQILSTCYSGKFFFNSYAVGQIQDRLKCIQLKKIYRQSDTEFIECLNDVRTGAINEAGLSWLNRRCNYTFEAPAGQPYVYLGNTRAAVEYRNRRMLAQIALPAYTYDASSMGVFDHKHVISPQQLVLKVGAQVMVTKNGAVSGCVNGTLGTVEELRDLGLKVRLADGRCVNVTPFTWHNTRYIYNPSTNRIESKTLGTFTQFPLVLAFAVTVHKSQGLTLSHVIADLAGAFETGQVYVALSRCQTLQGLVLRSRLQLRDIRVHPRVQQWSQKYVS